MANFNKKDWLSVGETGANDNNSVVNKENMNDLENRISLLDTSLTNLINNKLNIAYGTGTRNETNLSTGICSYAKIGNLVLLNFYNVKSFKDLSAIDNLFTNLPSNSTTYFGFLADMANNDIIMIAINSGNVRMNYDHMYSSGSYQGILWYRADN